MSPNNWGKKYFPINLVIESHYHVIFNYFRFFKKLRLCWFYIRAFPVALYFSEASNQADNCFSCKICGVSAGVCPYKKMMDFTSEPESNKSQKRNLISKEQSIKSGVRQDSVLGPLFFPTFNNDLSEYCTRYPYCFTYDRKLDSSSPIILRTDLLSLFMWSNQKKLSSSFEKKQSC